MPSRRTRDRTLLALIAVTVALVLAGTAWAVLGQPATPDRQAPPTVSTPSPRPSGSSMAPGSSAASSTAPATMKPTTKRQKVALEAARIMTTWDTTKDVNDAAAELRAKHLMTKDRAEKIIVGDGDSDNPTWHKVARDKATSEPELELVPSGDKDVVRVVARWSWHADGEKPLDDPLRRSFAFSFTKDAKNPKIEDYIWRDLN